MTESVEKGVEKINRSWITRLDDFSNKVATYRKILLNFFVMVVVLYLIIFLVATSFQKKLLVLPVDIPDKLKREGYSPEFFTQKIVERIEFIKQSASDYYSNNDIELMMNDDNIEIVNTLLDNTPLEGFKSMFIDFVNRNQEKAIGKVRDLNDKVQITYRIGNKTPVVVEKSTTDSLIYTAAEYIMEEVNPYYLSAYYFKSKEYDKCLRLVQKLLNSSDTKYKYLAFHIRGNVYINLADQYLDNDDSTNHWIGDEYLDYAQKIFDSAIVTNTFKSPWLSYNSMGAVFQNRRAYDSAKIWYKRSMSSNNSGANAFYNYGNILLDEFNDDNNKFRSYPDTAVFYFKEAIKRNPFNVSYYVGLLQAYCYGKHVEEAKATFFKCKDMDPNNLDIYSYMVQVYQPNDPVMAQQYMDLYKQKLKERGVIFSAVK
jgi:tetratricopeptide (TPR) repeat protein